MLGIRKPQPIEYSMIPEIISVMGVDNDRRTR